MDPVEELIYHIKRLYLYPSYAEVELDPRFEQKLRNAVSVSIVPEGERIRIYIDGKEYLAGIDRSVEVRYGEVSEEEIQQAREEAEEIRREYRRKVRNPLAPEIYYFLLENDNPDFAVVALGTIEIV